MQSCFEGDIHPPQFVQRRVHEQILANVVEVEELEHIHPNTHVDSGGSVAAGGA
jgi:hypothetical protein